MCLKTLTLVVGSEAQAQESGDKHVKKDINDVNHERSKTTETETCI